MPIVKIVGIENKKSKSKSKKIINEKDFKDELRISESLQQTFSSYSYCHL